jgi:galactokinase
LLRFGELLTASGLSSANLYEICHPRVEELVGEALAVEGVLGARMMGGGEGGTTLVLAFRAATKELEVTLRSGYYRRYGMEQRDGLLHVCAFAPGASVLSGSAIADLS